MKARLFCLVLGAAVVTLPPQASAQERFLFGGENQGIFLGCMNCSKYYNNSIHNKYGPHGDKYASESIFNKYGEYGGKYSDYSPCNKYASSPPINCWQGNVLRQAYAPWQSKT